MLRQMLPAAVAMALTAVAGTLIGTSADAADMPAQSQLGAIFAEPSEGGPPAVAPAAVRSDKIPMRVILYTLGNGLFARGGYNYGSPYSYLYNGPYYGGPYASTAPRLPYVCGLLGYC
jgi:hypothetical protein